MSNVSPSPQRLRQSGFSAESLIVLGLAVGILGGLLLGAVPSLGIALAVLGGVAAQIGIIAKGVEIGVRAAGRG